MEYRIENQGDRYFIYDSFGKFVCSADNYREAQEEIAELELEEQANNTSYKKYYVEYLRAKARWITKNGQRLQVPIVVVKQNCNTFV